MKSYLYTPFELALIIQHHALDCNKYMDLLHNIYQNDKSFLLPEYRNNQKKLFLDVMDNLNYINNTENYLSEIEAIEKDSEALGLVNNYSGDNLRDSFNHLIFKELRIRILYINTRGFACLKLRTLLSEFGYKRRSPYIIQYIIDCLNFYHISVSLRGNVPCDIKSVSIDDTIVFRTV